MKEQTYLCIDPSLTLTGWGILLCGPGGPVVVGTGTIDTQKMHDKQYMSDLLRWEAIARELREAMKNVSAVVLEASAGYGGRTSSRAAICMKSSQAVVASLTAARGLPWEAYLPQAAKKSVTGSRSASKARVEEAVRMGVVGAGSALDGYKSKAKREAVADALAVGLAAWNSRIIRMLRQL